MATRAIEPRKVARCPYDGFFERGVQARILAETPIRTGNVVMATNKLLKPDEAGAVPVELHGPLPVCAFERCEATVVHRTGLARWSL